MSYMLAGDTKEVCSSESLPVVPYSLPYFLCCNASYWKLAIPKRMAALEATRWGFLRSKLSEKIVVLLGRYKKSNSCIVCPPGRMTTPSLRCPSSWPVSTLLKNSEFPAGGVICFHPSFAVVVGWPSRGSLMGDPSGMEGALLCTLQAQISRSWLPVLHPDPRGEDCQGKGLA